jgi:pimeloyl-ACP methyl ester carboxylesterase
MARPRLLLVPMLCELEWTIKPRLEEWAEVASYDAPGVGEEKPAEDFGSEAIAQRGLAEMESRGWDRCVVLADEFGVAAATLLASRRPEAIQGLVLGHARLSNESKGDRPTMNAEVFAAMSRMIRSDYRSAVRQFAGLTAGERRTGGYAEEWTRRFVERVPQDMTAHFYSLRPEVGTEFGEHVGRLSCPLFFIRHRDCLMFTHEGFDDAVAAFPEAKTLTLTDKPSTSPEFADALRSWCEEIGA